VGGRVVGPAGEPVAGASVARIEEHGVGGGGTTSYGRSTHPLARTDSQGRFRADGLEPGALSLEVSAQGYKTRALRGLALPEDADVEDLEIALERGAAVTGRVLDARGRPVAGARVSSLREHDERAEMSMPLSSLSAETDGEGVYRLGGLDPGRHRITAFSPEGLRAEVVTVVRPGDNLVNLSFGRSTEVSGRVADEASQPVAGAAVTLSGNSDSQMVSSDADGAFRFAAVPDGTYGLNAGSRGLIGPAEPLEVEVRGQPVGGLEIRLRRGGTLLTGRLLGLEPGDLEKIAVAAHSADRPWEERRGTVERDGSYRLSGLLPGAWQVVASLDSGRKAQGSIQLEPDQEQAVLDLELTRGLVLSGRVLADGAPLVAAQVVLSSPTTIGNRPETATDYDGRFRLEGLAPGTYVVQVLHPPTGLGAARRIELTGDADVALEIATGAVRGQVVLPPGEPAAGLAIALEGEDATLGTSFLGPAVQLDDQGRFEIPRVAAGAYRLILRQDGRSIASRPVQVEPGDTAVVRFEV
jgi:protocatechuate 3,4-dioxygenase beta subunit